MGMFRARWLVAGCTVVALAAGAVVAPRMLASEPVAASAAPSKTARASNAGGSPTGSTGAGSPGGTGSSAAGSSAGAGSASGSPGNSPSGTPASSTRPSAPVDDRSGKALARPFTVDGVIVVSAKHRVSAGYRPKVSGPGPLVAEAGAAFQKLVRAARKQGLRLQVISGYRSYASQRALRASLTARFGRGYAAKYVAVPGTSEHQTGLAIDLRSPSGRGTTFDRTKEWRWLRAHAQDHGFVLRYPKGKTKVTGIGYEPWHWRYVGVEVAKAIRAQGPDVTLEEYLGLA